MAVVVTGIGLVSALSSNADQAWQRLLSGESAIALRQPFPELRPRPLAMLGKQPAKLDKLLIAATQATIQDAGLSGNLPDCGVVIGSSRGHQAQWEGFLTTGMIDNWADSLPHMGAITVARYVGSQGPVLSPMAACATGVWAIAQGTDLIRSGQCDRVLVGAGEAAITPLTLAGFEQMRAMATTGCYPFDQRREGLVLGEGAALLMLESEDVARDRSARIYARLLGAGLTADANHVSAPDATSHTGGLAAIRTCLERSQLTPDAVDLIHAHGTSTRLNDVYECALIQTIFPGSVWVTATKGATGHTLGASGAIGAVMCVMALQQQVVPPCVGLRDPAFNLRLTQTAERTPLTTALCFSFGFGGQNAVIALRKP
jgi:3-oxoacyl-[acyl-carrier-protein] synthase II